MIIEHVAASYPSRKVSNGDVVDLIGTHSTGYSGDLARALRSINTLLDRSGLVSRHWCARGERPIDHVASAVEAALSGSHLTAADVDLFVYVGIGGGFREPANSYITASALGFERAECFDVIDACMSWTRAMALVDSLFKTGGYRSAMIVNAEFNMVEGGPLYPANFTLAHAQQLEYLLPSFTIGEAATATLLLPDEPDNFAFTFHSKPRYADLCTIPTAGFEGFCASGSGAGHAGVGRFAAQGAALHQRLGEELPHLLRKARVDEARADVVFTHSSSSAEWHKACGPHALADKIHHVYPHTGNIVSASIPAALADARAQGRIAKGQRALCLMGSAGMSFAASTFTL